MLCSRYRQRIGDHVARTLVVSTGHAVHRSVSGRGTSGGHARPARSTRAARPSMGRPAGQLDGHRHGARAGRAKRHGPGHVRLVRTAISRADSPGRAGPGALRSVLSPVGGLAAAMRTSRGHLAAGQVFLREPRLGLSRRLPGDRSLIRCGTVPAGSAGLRRRRAADGGGLGYQQVEVIDRSRRLRASGSSGPGRRACRCREVHGDRQCHLVAGELAAATARPPWPAAGRRGDRPARQSWRACSAIPARARVAAACPASARTTFSDCRYSRERQRGRCLLEPDRGRDVRQHMVPGEQQARPGIGEHHVTAGVARRRYRRQRPGAEIEDLP